MKKFPSKIPRFYRTGNRCLTVSYFQHTSFSKIPSFLISLSEDEITKILTNPKPEKEEKT